LIAHVSPIFLLPVCEKSVIFDDFPAIAHSISAPEGGNTLSWKAMAWKRTVDDSMTYWFPWNDLYCVGWGVKLYSLTHPLGNTLWRDYGA